MSAKAFSDLFCSAGGGLWPTAEMPAGGRGGRLLGYCGHELAPLPARVGRPTAAIADSRGRE
jgi:hypothetical protein